MPGFRIPPRRRYRRQTTAACAAVVVSALFTATQFAGPVAADTQEQAVADLSMSDLAHPVALSPVTRAAMPSARVGRVCKAGFDIRSTRNTAEDAPAAAVDMDKSCRGAVLVRFAASGALPADTDGNVATAIAKCVGNGGYANACTEGDVHFGVPEDQGVQRAGAGSGKPVHAAQWVYSDLKAGVWKFYVRPAEGGGDTYLQSRSLSVLAFKGG